MGADHALKRIGSNLGIKVPGYSTFNFLLQIIPFSIKMFRNKGWGISGCNKKTFVKRNVFLTTTIDLCISVGIVFIARNGF